MTDDSEHKYRMTLSLNVLKHLGLGLYSNVPAVLSEVVANAWDADAEHVTIEIDAQGDMITIQDDGHGMSVNDTNERYLSVGYERRNQPNGARTPRFDRPAMGRKGIGKLSLFSIAKTVEVHSVKGDERHGFRMNLEKIEGAIEDGGEGDYSPEPIDPKEVLHSRGTKITLTNMKRRLNLSSAALRRRLARRFSIIGETHSFQIKLDGSFIGIEDRDYYSKIQYMLKFGERGEDCRSVARNVVECEARPVEVEGDAKAWEIGGWIGTVEKAGQLKDSDTGESINKIVLMVRGKLAQEDVLEEFSDGGLYTKYVFGEIHADFLDQDHADDIATTSRQRIIEEDPRYQALKVKLQAELRVIANKWTDLRNKRGRDVAVSIPQIEEWYRSLSPDHKRAAERLFGKINQLLIDDASQKRQLLVSGILAFESLKLRNLLHRLDEVSAENLGALNEVFLQLDDLEASAYYQIAKDRLGVIRKLTSLVDDDAKERALTEHLYKHLWLLDPSWERASHTPHMETRINTVLRGPDGSLTDKEKLSRIDIRYTTTGKKHVIIELKRASRLLRTGELVDQINGYRTAVSKVLESLGKTDESLEIICVVGKPLQDWSAPDGRKVSRDTLAGSYARVVMYDELIENALEAYQEYVDREQDAGRVYRLITSIEAEDFHAMSPQPG